MVRPRPVLVCALVAVSAWASATRAQPALPVNVQPLTQADEQAVAAYLRPLVRALEQGGTDEAQQARDRLVAPVREPTSVSFRLYYSGQLDDAVNRIVTRDADPWRVNLALAVAGAVASDAMLSAITAALEDPRPAVRLAAARDLGVLLAQTDADNDAVQDARLDEAIRRAEAAFRVEPSVFVAGALARALATPTTPSIQDRSLVAMARGFAAWLDARPPAADDAEESLLATLGTLGAVRNLYVRRQIAGAAPADLTDAVKALARSVHDAAQRIARGAQPGEAGVRLRALADRTLSVADALRQLASAD